MKLLGVALLSLAALTPLLAENHPNLSGTWKLNTDKGDATAGPKSLVVKIDHKDPVFQYSVTGEAPDGSPIDENVKFTTDGKENVQDNGGKLDAHWEGKALVARFVSPDGAYTQIGKVTLTPDGKSLDRDVQEKGPEGERHYHQVFEKQ